MNFYRELTSDEQVIYKSLFRGDKSNYVPEEINGKSANSCDYHAMTRAHTEILGVFLRQYCNIRSGIKRNTYYRTF